MAKYPSHSRTRPRTGSTRGRPAGHILPASRLLLQTPSGSHYSHTTPTPRRSLHTHIHPKQHTPRPLVNAHTNRSTTSTTHHHYRNTHGIQRPQIPPSGDTPNWRPHTSTPHGGHIPHHARPPPIHPPDTQAPYRPLTTRKLKPHEPLKNKPHSLSNNSPPRNKPPPPKST